MSLMMNSFTMPASDVRVDALFVQGFAIAIGDTENGTVSVEKDFAANASTVKVEVIPDAGYLVESVTYTSYGNVNTIEADENGVYSFVMPWDNVTISASFAVDENYDPEEMLEPEGQCGESLYWNFTDGVLNIFGEGDMYNCALEEVEVPASVEGLGIYIFGYNDNLKNVYLHASAFGEYNMYAFNEVPRTCVMHVPADLNLAALTEENGGAVYFWYKSYNTENVVADL